MMITLVTNLHHFGYKSICPNEGAAPPPATRSSKEAKGTSLSGSCRGLVVACMMVVVLVVAVVLAVEVQEDNKRKLERLHSPPV